MGKLIVITAPSGAGKTTIVRHLVKTFDFLGFSISATTREKRNYELDGKDYHFMTVEDFKKMRRQKKFLEWEEVYENQFYGTLRSEVERIWREGKHIIFDVDVKGAKDIKKAYPNETLAIFVKPPSVDELFARLRNRKTESEASLKKRFARSKRELKYEKKFDEVLINDDLKIALKEAEEMVINFTKNNNNISEV
ncbi:MAG: guanylate kinase [Saprospiraceae bacterium]|nr:guanylate kinase [Saprospiraceae bacterium]MDC3210444.1 guanylate kinase [Saprospiraceae bacterium]MDG1433192.1 guanylate kinase [Saprospiraceae bacterium]MDG2417913.1 guanylate kinase [Saprospiraceae bacterium]